MKRILLMMAVVMPITLLAQKKLEVKGFELRQLKDVEAQDVQNQNRTGTCWSFSTLSFLESEVKRLSGKEVKLSEMWIVRHTYIEKAERYVRFHGNVNFDAGGAFHDVTAMIKKYGIVPQSEYTGLGYGRDKHYHGELNTVLKAMCDAIIKNRNGELTTAWQKAIASVIDAYLGDPVTEFTFEEKTFNPMSFRDYLKINPDDYVVLTSFTHQPMNEPFILELPDNWMHEVAYNITLDDFMSTMDYSIDRGYSIAWAADVSESGFRFRDGLALVPENGFKGMSKTQVDSALKSGAVKEKQIGVGERQAGYDNYTTTDDHGMHITGMYRDQNGNLFFKVKNSWGDQNECDGYFFASEAYVKYKTIDIMVHKDALPKTLKKKLGIQ